MNTGAVCLSFELLTVIHPLRSCYAAKMCLFSIRNLNSTNFPAPLCLLDAMRLNSKQLCTVPLRRPDIILITFEHRAVITSAAQNKRQNPKQEYNAAQ